MQRNPLLIQELTDALLVGMLERSTNDLAQATRPDFLGNSNSPVQWSPADWDRLESEREELLDFSAINEQWNEATYWEDGYAIFNGVMKPKAVDDWTAALQFGQQLNDALIASDWSKIDWQALGRMPPAEFLAQEVVANALGGSQELPQSDDVGVQTLRQHSVLAEYFPAGHVEFLMNVLTHPQMLRLQRMCLGCEDIYFDHNQLLTRRGGYPGGAWHSHSLGGGRDNCGIADLTEYRNQPNTNLTLCYPQGFKVGDDGGVKIIRGSHLFRDPANCRAADDEAMEQVWLQGRVHPITAKPLEIESFSLPPGSIICCLSHGAHGVAPKALGTPSRLASVYCYRKADEVSRHAQPSTGIPTVWAMKAQRGELPEVPTELFRPSYDRELTGGRKTRG
jgi:hypothetical protein